MNSQLIKLVRICSHCTWVKQQREINAIFAWSIMSEQICLTTQTCLMALLLMLQNEPTQSTPGILWSLSSKNKLPYHASSVLSWNSLCKLKVKHNLIFKMFPFPPPPSPPPPSPSLNVTAILYTSSAALIIPFIHIEVCSHPAICRGLLSFLNRTKESSGSPYILCWERIEENEYFASQSDLYLSYFFAWKSLHYYSALSNLDIHLHQLSGAFSS